MLVLSGATLTLSVIIKAATRRSGEQWNYTLEFDSKEVTVVKQNAAVILIIVICPNVSSISFTEEGPPLRLVLGWARAGL